MILSLAAVLATMTPTAAPAIAADHGYYSNYDRDGLYYESYENPADYSEDSSYYSLPYYNFYSPFYGYSPYPYYNFRD